MPDFFNIDDYVSVQERIRIFWDTYPEGRIKTEMVHLDGPDITARMVVIKSWIWTDGGSKPADSTGYAKEREGTKGANMTAFIENCETSSIGRALANLGIGVSKNRPSREDMEGVQADKKEHKINLQNLKAYAANLKEDDPVRTKLREEWKQLEHNPLEVFKLIESFNLNITEVEEVTQTVS